MADMLPQLVNVHGRDRETTRRTWLLARAVVHDQSEHRSTPGKEGGELIYGRRKAMTLKCFHFNQYRPKSTLGAGDKCRRVDAVTTTRDSLRLDLGTTCLQKTKHLFLQTLVAVGRSFQSMASPTAPQMAPGAVRSHEPACGSPELW